MRRTFILKKDLFKIKKGRIFHTTHDGQTVYPYFTDEEVIYNKGDFFLYQFPISLVDNDEDGWFEEITERNNFVKQIYGTYKFYLPSGMELPNLSQQREVKKDGIIVGHVTNFDMATGEGTIELLPEFAETIWKEIAGPFVGTVTSRTVDTPEKVDNIIEDFLKDSGNYKEPEPIIDIDDEDDLSDFFGVFRPSTEVDIRPEPPTELDDLLKNL